MSKQTDKFYPGWKMTRAQHDAYFRLLEQVYRAKGVAKSSGKEVCRKQIHVAAFGTPISAKMINHLKGFDDFKAACLAETQPANVGAQMRQAGQPLIRLRHRITSDFDQPFWRKIARDKFGTDDLEQLTEKQLTDLRNTLCARESGWREVDDVYPLGESLDVLDDPESPLNKSYPVLDPVTNGNPF